MKNYVLTTVFMILGGLVTVGIIFGMQGTEKEQDNFARNQECFSHKESAEEYIDYWHTAEGEIAEGDSAFFGQIFYSPSRESCLFSYSLHVDNPLTSDHDPLHTFYIVDLFTQEVLYEEAYKSATEESGESSGIEEVKEAWRQEVEYLKQAEAE